MKRLRALLGAALLAAGVVLPFGTVYADAGQNLIANPGFETANGSSPAGWNNNAWGSNKATFSYDKTGRGGGWAASVNISNYKTGDAKWAATPVSVQPSTEYVFSNWYKSTAASGVDVAVTNSANKVSYLHIADPAVSGDWKQQTVSFKTPAKAKTVTIYHYLSANGSLAVDDYSLTVAGSAPAPTPSPTPTPTPAPTPPPTPTPTPSGNNLVANPSAESASNGQPAGWVSNSWGTNTPAFSYANDAQDGSKSLKTTISSYTNGDAKWYFNPVAVTPGSNYVYTEWYKSDIQAEVDAMVTMNDGSQQFYYIASPAAASNWTKVSYQFTAPSGAKNVTFFHVVSKKGYVQIDNVSLTKYVPEQLDRGLVSLTFDDGWRNIYSNGLPLLKKYGLPSTQYLNSEPVIGGYPDYMTYQMIKDFKAQGSELAWHTRSHADVTKLTAAQLTTELTVPQPFLTGTGTSAADFRNFATPYGAYNPTAISAIMKKFQSHRSTDIGYNSKDNLDVTNIKVQNITNTTTPADVQSWVNQAAANKTWLVIVYHEVTGSPADPTYAVTPANLDQELNIVKQSGLTVKTVDQAIAEIKSQL